MSPQEAAEKMMLLSEKQSRLSDEATRLEIGENQFLFENREKYGSDKATNIAWKVTKDGTRQVEVVNKLRSLKSELSVIKNFLRHEENKARNLY